MQPCKIGRSSRFIALTVAGSGTFTAVFIVAAIEVKGGVESVKLCLFFIDNKFKHLCQ